MHEVKKKGGGGTGNNVPSFVMYTTYSGIEGFNKYYQRGEGKRACLRIGWDLASIKQH